MEDLEQYLTMLKSSEVTAQKIIKKLEDDKQNIRHGLSGEAEIVYKQQCDQVIDELKKLQKKIRILYSESSTES